MPEFFNVNIPATVIGIGAIRQIGNIAKDFGPRKILVLTDIGVVNAGLIDVVRSTLEESGLHYKVFDGCKEEPPIASLTEIIDTGMDALAHAIESYTCPNANAFSDMLATTAIKMIAENLRKAYELGELDMEARYHMSLAAAYAMNAVGSD